MTSSFQKRPAATRFTETAKDSLPKHFCHNWLVLRERGRYLTSWPLLESSQEPSCADDSLQITPRVTQKLKQTKWTRAATHPIQFPTCPLHLFPLVASLDPPPHSALLSWSPTLEDRRVPLVSKNESLYKATRALPTHEQQPNALRQRVAENTCSTSCSSGTAPRKMKHSDLKMGAGWQKSPTSICSLAIREPAGSMHSFSVSTAQGTSAVTIEYNDKEAKAPPRS